MFHNTGNMATTKTASSDGTPAGVVLCIDDDQGTLEVMKSILGTNGYSVLTSSDWCGTLAVLTQNAIDVVIVDYEMPGMSGYEAALRIRSVSPEAPIILHSDSLVSDLAGKRIDACVPKGTDPAMMVAAISSLITNSRKKHSGSVVPMEKQPNVQGQKIAPPDAFADVA